MTNESEKFRKDFGLKDQIRRASVSFQSIRLGRLFPYFYEKTAKMDGINGIAGIAGVIAFGLIARANAFGYTDFSIS